MEMEEFIIRNEDDAWAVLDRVVRGDARREHISIEFQDWPKLSITLKGEGYHGTITPRVMEGVIEIQKSLYRSYSLYRYNSSDLRRLTDEDKDELEITVRVEEGSSILDAAMSGPLNTLANGIADKVEPVHVVITVLGIALMYFGKDAYRAWLDKEREKKQMEVQTTMSEQETQRMQIFADAIARQPRLETVRDDAEDTYNAVLRSSLRADSVKFNDVEIPTEEARRVVASPRKKAKDVRLDGPFRILQVDTSDLEGIKVKMRHEDGTVVVPVLQEGDINMRQRDILKEAEWSGSSVYVALNAKELRGEITGASIIDVREMEE